MWLYLDGLGIDMLEKSMADSDDDHDNGWRKEKERFMSKYLFFLTRWQRSERVRVKGDSLEN